MNVRRAVPAWFCLLLALAACGGNQNTPEEAFESVRTALAEERWELLYDILPPEVQQSFDQQIVENDQRIQALAAQAGGPATDEQLRREFGFDRAQWQKMTVKQRFAGIFRKTAKLELRRLGVNPDYVVSSDVTGVMVRGSEAVLSIDDGKGHRSRLKFVLVGGVWRFGLGTE